MKVHSIVELITNSSTMIYTTATKRTVECAKALIAAVGGNVDEFEIKLVPSDALCERILDNDDKLYSKLEHLPYREQYVELARMIEAGEVEFDYKPTIEYENVAEFDLVVLKNGKPVSEFNQFFNSFDQDSWRDG